MNDAVQQIKDRLDIVDVVSSYVRLTKAGRHFKGLSPFKKEKTPSFFVSSEKGLYYCFSTQKGGDMFSFVQELEGVDFQGALKILADRAGVELTPVSKEARSKEERLFALMEQATVLYQTELGRHSQALEYLKERGLNTETISAWRLGYAPTSEAAGWRYIREKLTREGYTDDELLRAGLVKWKDESAKKGEPFDRFRARILFPLFDVSGRVIAFSGRLFPDDGSGKAPKYLNSPDTALFHKSNVLYGYDRAKQSIRKHDFSILVEGQMDLVLSHQSGWSNTVAVSGTGLTEAHTALLSRLSKNVVFAFDGDSAGIASSIRGAHIALSLGMDVKVAGLPVGKDPADCIKENSEEWRSAVRGATHIIPYLLGVFESIARDSRTLVKMAEERILPLIAVMPNKMDQSYFVGVVAERLKLSQSAVEAQLSAVAGKASAVVERATSTERPSSDAERKVAALPLDRKEQIIRSLIGIERATKESNTPLSALIESGLKEVLEATEHTKLEEHYANDTGLLFEVELHILSREQPEALAKTLLHDLRYEITKESFHDAMRALHEAEARGETARAESLLQELNTLRGTLAELQGSTP